MSPTVTDFESPITSHKHTQNPKFDSPHSGLHGSNMASQCDSKTVSSSNIGGKSDGAFNYSFSLPFESLVTSEKPTTRSKPRFVKVRKQFGSQNARSKAMADNSNPVKNGNSPYKLSYLVSDFKSEDLDNLSFVFGANQSDTVLNSNLQPRESIESVEQIDSGGFGKLNSSGFVFGSDNMNLKTGDCDKSLNFVFGDNKKFVGLHSILKDRENGGDFFNKLGFGFDAKKSNLTSGSKEFGGKVEKFDFAELNKLKNMVYTSCSNNVIASSSLNLEKREPSENIGGKCEGREKGEEDNKSELTKPGNLDYVFGYRDCDSASFSNIKKKESNPSFVFGAGWSDLRSSLHSENIGSYEKDVSYENMTFTSQGGKFDNVSFVFGDNNSYSAPNVDAEKKKFSRNDVKLDFVDKSKMNVNSEADRQKSKINGVFLFGSVTKESSHLNGCFKLGAEINKLKSGKAENCNGEVKEELNSTGCDVNSKFNFVFGSSSNLDSAFGRSQVFKLSDEMQKLDLHDSEKVDTAGSYTDLHSNSFPNNKPSVSATGSSHFTPFDHFKDSNIAGPQNDRAFEKVDGVNTSTRDTKASFFGTKKETFNSFGGHIDDTMPSSMRNTDTIPGEGLLNEQRASSYSSGFFGKENQPINLSEKSTVGYPSDQLNNDTELNKSSFPSSPSSMAFGFQPFGSVSEAPTIDRIVKDKEFIFTSTPVQNGRSFTGFSMPNSDMSSPFTANLFPGLNKELEFSLSSRSAGGRKLKKKGRKMRQRAQNPTEHNHLSKEFTFQQNEESPACGSPMDFSPYQDTDCAASAAHMTASTKVANEALSATGERYDMKEDANKSSKGNEKGSSNNSATEPLINSRTGRVSINGSAGVAAAEFRDFCSSMDREENDEEKQSFFALNSENPIDRRYSSSASSYAHDNLSATKRQSKKYRMKIGQGSNCTTPSLKLEFTSSNFKISKLACDSSQQADILNTQIKGERVSKVDGEHLKKDLSEAGTLETCEKLRIRGNEAYKKGNLSEAENLYTKCIDSIKQTMELGCYIEPLVLCYSNRSATRLSLGRIREALGDCEKAASLDSKFLKVHIRAANCHLLLGEVEDASRHFNKCLDSRMDVCLDRRIMIEAADGLQKAQKVVEFMNQCAELLCQKTSDAANNVLRIITEAMSISRYSEKLLKMKGEALCMLRKYEDVIQLCEKTTEFAERNFSCIDPAHHLSNMDCSLCNYPSIRMWRWSLMSQAYFHMGRLEVALDLTKKKEQLRSIRDKYGSETSESSVTLAATIDELLRSKNAGNKAFQRGNHTEAIEHYTAAISCSMESRPFAAVCFGNRAAAHQALGEIADAIADCSLAIALDGNYGKALSRRATLHERIRDYELAANDLQRFISVLEKQSHETRQQCGTSLGTSGSRVEQLRQARDRLYTMEQKAKKETPLEFYLILGIKASDTTSEIKKAYHRAALKHHPDKTGQFLARSESGDDVELRKEIADKIHLDADRLFKMIGEAYAVLSDQSKRSKYDLEEEIRNDKESNISSSSGRQPNFYSSPFESRSSRRSGQEWNTYGGSWKTYGKSHSGW